MEMKLAASEAEIQRITIVARKGWESVLELVSAVLEGDEAISKRKEKFFLATEHAADEALAALDVGGDANLKEEEPSAQNVTQEIDTPREAALRRSARAGWESLRELAIAGLHRATERAADEALDALDAGERLKGKV